MPACGRLLERDIASPSLRSWRRKLNSTDGLRQNRCGERAVKLYTLPRMIFDDDAFPDRERIDERDQAAIRLL